MEQKLLMNSILFFFIGYFFHSIMKYGLCGRNVEGYEWQGCTSAKDCTFPNGNCTMVGADGTGAGGRKECTTSFKWA